MIVKLNNKIIIITNRINNNIDKHKIVIQIDNNKIVNKNNNNIDKHKIVINKE